MSKTDKTEDKERRGDECEGAARLIIKMYSEPSWGFQGQQRASVLTRSAPSVCLSVLGFTDAEMISRIMYHSFIINQAT